MKLSRPTRRVLPETIIPLIDVVFFLLIFFMLIGRMDATSPFEVQPATAVTGSDMPAGGATVSVGPDGQLALDGGDISRAALATAIAAALAEDRNLLIRVNAHWAVELRHVLPLVAEIEQLGAADIVLVVTPESR